MNDFAFWNPGDHVLIWSVNVLFQVTVLTAAALLIARALRRTPALRYWVLYASLLLLILTPGVAAVMQSSGISLVSVALIDENAAAANPATPAEPAAETQPPEPQTPPGSIEPQPAVALEAMPPIPRDPAMMDDFGSDLPEPAAPGVPPIAADSSLSESTAPTDAAKIPALQPTTTVIGKILRVAMPPLLIVWLAGMVFLLGRLALGYARLLALMRTARPNTNASLEALFAEIGRAAQVTHWRWGLPPLLLSGRVSGPVSAGLRRPCIILPDWIIDRVTPRQLHDILVHELAHVARRDQFVVLLQHLAGAFLWLHPLAAMLNRRLAQAREELCDNYVLAVTDAPSYSRTLLTLAELVQTTPALPGTVSLLASRWKLERRVAGLLDERRSRTIRLTTRAKMLLVGLSLLIATVAACGTITPAGGGRRTNDDAEQTRTRLLRFPENGALETVTLGARHGSDESAPTERAASENAKDELSSSTSQNGLPGGPTLRGAGKNREMLLRGRVFDVDGKPARGFEFVAKASKSRLGRDVLPTRVEGSEFEVWVPIGGSDWFYVELAATARDGNSRAFEGIGNRELRQAAINGIDLQLAPANRSVEISVTHNGALVANAHVNAALSGNMLLQNRTDAKGKATFRLREGEKLSQLTAWTDDYRIGGYSFHRKPRRDPFGDEFTIELDDCRDQTIRFLNVDDDSPVRNVPFKLVIGTGKPNYNFAAVPATFPHCRMTTDEDGEATCRWFPDWETHGAYVEIIDPRWATAVDNSDMKTGDDGALVMTLKRRAPRKPIVGKVRSDRFDVGGLLVEIKSFQGEEEGRSDHVYAFTDEDGNFTADCIPGATYTVCVNDGRMVSNMIDLIPYEPDTGKTNVAELELSEGTPVEIRVTSGPRREPMQNQRVYVRQVHRYTWREDDEKRSGQGARDYPVYTDKDGAARARAFAGSELRVSVNAGEWRSGDRYVTVKENGVTRIEIHREFDTERDVTGRLLATPKIDVELAGAEIIFGSIDGNTDEREAITADARGRFAFKTKAIQLGIFAYTTDGKAAGVAKPEKLDGPIEIQLKPTMDLHGRLLGKNDEPLANHAVRVKPRVSGKRDFNKSFATSFVTRTFETKTDANGNYTLKDLPTEFDMTLRADPIDGSEYDAYLDDFYLVVGDKRARVVSRLGRTSQPDDRTLSEKYDGLVRDAKLGAFHVLVLSYDAASDEFVDAKVLDHDGIRKVMSFLNLRIGDDSVTTDADRKFAESKNWPQPTQGKVFVCALDATGKELGRILLDSGNADAATEAAEFIRKHAPPQADAQAKWEAAFAEAKRSGRHVWARIGQRYCGPCFRLSRWLDDNRELLERDYVLLKIDNIRDKHGNEVANRIVSNREHYGVPFHAIFDANERLLIDSEAPIGNIGHPSSFEGRRHVTKMLSETCSHLSPGQIEQIVERLQE